KLVISEEQRDLAPAGHQPLRAVKVVSAPDRAVRLPIKSFLERPGQDPLVGGRPPEALLRRQRQELVGHAALAGPEAHRALPEHAGVELNGSTKLVARVLGMAKA